MIIITTSPYSQCPKGVGGCWSTYLRTTFSYFHKLQTLLSAAANKTVNKQWAKALLDRISRAKVIILGNWQDREMTWRRRRRVSTLVGCGCRVWSGCRPHLLQLTHKVTQSLQNVFAYLIKCEKGYCTCVYVRSFRSSVIHHTITLPGICESFWGGRGEHRWINRPSSGILNVKPTSGELQRNDPMFVSWHAQITQNVWDKKKKSPLDVGVGGVTVGQVSCYANICSRASREWKLKRATEGFNTRVLSTWAFTPRIAPCGGGWWWSSFTFKWVHSRKRKQAFVLHNFVGNLFF